MCHKFSFLSTFQSIYFFLFIAIVNCGCTSYKIDTQSFLNTTTSPDANKDPTPEIMEIKEKALSHWIYDFIPRHRSQIEWYDVGHWTTWALFGNDDDGLFGEESTAHYRIYQQIEVSKAISWGFRNPFHNFCYYVIGSADQINSEFTLLRLTDSDVSFFTFKEIADTVFPSKSSSLFITFHGGKPFLAMRIVYFKECRGDFYFGWRCRGNFGIKFQPLLFGERKK
jgi:hypothetical protein